MQKKSSVKNSSVISSVKNAVSNAVSSVKNAVSDFFLSLTAQKQIESEINRLSYVECSLENALTKIKAKKEELREALLITQSFFEQIEQIETIKDFIERNAQFGQEFSFNEAKQILFPEKQKQIVKTSIRQSVIEDNENSINYPLLWECMNVYKCSFKELPFEVRAQFNGNTRSKYTSYFPYFNSLLTNGNTGNGYIAMVIKQKGISWFEGKKPSDFPYIPNFEKVSDGTINQFIKIYKAFKQYQNA